MPKMRIQGHEGVMVLGPNSLNLDDPSLYTNPMAHRNNFTFHSGMPYLQVKALLTAQPRVLPAYSGGGQSAWGEWKMSMQVLKYYMGAIDVHSIPNPIVILRYQGVVWTGTRTFMLGNGYRMIFGAVDENGGVWLVTTAVVFEQVLHAFWLDWVEAIVIGD